MARLVLLDNTVLSNFALVRRFHWLASFPQPIATTPQAFDELIQGTRIRRIPEQDWSWIRVLDLDAEASDVYTALRPSLGAGEASCLAMAWQRNGQVATDDKRARQQARDLGVSVTGTLGILVQLVEGEAVSLTEANQALSEMIESGYRSPLNRLDVLIAPRNHKSGV
jgi:predicted nucleic acid-binding protein